MARPCGPPPRRHRPPGSPRWRPPPRAWLAGCVGCAGRSRGLADGKAGGLGGRAGERVLHVRAGNSRFAGDRRPARPETRVAGSSRVQAASQQAGPLPSGRLCAGSGGGAEGGSGREPEVGPAAFLGIRWRRSLPPPLGPVQGWAPAASWCKCAVATLLLPIVALPRWPASPKET